MGPYSDTVKFREFLLTALMKVPQFDYPLPRWWQRCADTANSPPNEVLIVSLPIENAGTAGLGTWLLAGLLQSITSATPTF